MPNRRTFQRFDIITVLEFNLMTAIAGTFAGITRNFSYEGFCVETQCVSFEQGDSMEIRLRHPHSDLTVSLPAYVVWKRTADKFAYLMGIKLKETELDTRLKMLEIMSAAGDLPVDSFLSEGSDEGIEHEKTATLSSDINQLETYRSEPEPAEANDEVTEPEAFIDEGLLSTEKELITGKISGDTFTEVFRAAQTAEPEEEYMPEPEEDVESDMLWPRVEEKADKAPYSITSVLKQLKGNRTFIYSSIAAVIVGVSVYAIFLILQRTGPAVNIPAPVPAQVPAQTALRQEEKIPDIVPPVQDAGDYKAAAPAVQQPDEQPVSKPAGSKQVEREVPASPPKLPDIRTADDQTRYIQVGAWKDPANAREMLQKIKKHYPDAYLTAGKKLNRVKIPAKNQAQVNSILRDIEDKFHVKALVSSVR